MYFNNQLHGQTYAPQLYALKQHYHIFIIYFPIINSTSTNFVDQKYINAMCKFIFCTTQIIRDGGGVGETLVRILGEKNLKKNS